MKYPEYWAGTLEENRTARQDVGNLINQLAIAGDCMDDNCCPDVPSTVTILHRVASDNSSLEMSIDGGETWLPDNTDPRGQVMSTPAPVGSVAASKCEAAANIVQGLMEAQTVISDTLSAGGSLQTLALEVITAILALLLLPPLGAAVLLTIVFGLIRHFLAMGQAAYDALFTAENWDRVTCAFYCAMDDDGKLSASGMETAKRIIYKNVPGQNSPTGAAQNIVELINFVGLAGLNLFAYTYQADGANCDDCECPTCEIDYDFQVLPFYWVLDDVKGTWELGANKGWKSIYKVTTDQTYYVAKIEQTFVEPCFAGYLHLSFFITDHPDRNARVGFDRLLMVDNVLTWENNGFNISPGEPGAHSDTVVFSSQFSTPVYGFRLTVLNIAKPVGHYLSSVAIDNTP